jgi:hypothetical protein
MSEMQNGEAPRREMKDEPPPILGNWANVYTFVLIYLTAVITVFYLFTRAMA